MNQQARQGLPEVRLLHTLTGNKMATGLTFSPSGALLAVSELGGSVGLWNTQTGEMQNVLGEALHRRGCLALSFSLDGNRCLAMMDDGCLVRFSVPDGEVEESFYLLGRVAFKSIASFSLGGSMVALGGEYDDIVVFDTAQKEVLCKINGQHLTRDFFLSSDGSLLAVSYSSGVVLWEIPSGRRLLKIKQGAVGCLALSCDNSLLVLGGNNGDVMVVDSRGNKLAYVPCWGVRTIADVAVSADNRLIVASDWFTTRLWSLPHQKTVHLVSFSGAPVAFSHDSRLFAVGGVTGKHLLFEIEANECTRTTTI